MPKKQPKSKRAPKRTKKTKTAAPKRVTGMYGFNASKLNLWERIRDDQFDPLNAMDPGTLQAYQAEEKRIQAEFQQMAIKYANLEGHELADTAWEIAWENRWQEGFEAVLTLLVDIAERLLDVGSPAGEPPPGTITAKRTLFWNLAKQFEAEGGTITEDGDIIPLMRAMQRGGLLA